MKVEKPLVGDELFEQLQVPVFDRGEDIQSVQSLRPLARARSRKSPGPYHRSLHLVAGWRERPACMVHQPRVHRCFGLQSQSQGPRLQPWAKRSCRRRKLCSAWKSDLGKGRRKLADRTNCIVAAPAREWIQSDILPS